MRFLVLIAVACVPMEPSGNPFAPVRPEAQPAVGPAVGPRALGPPSQPQGSFDFEAEDREPDRPPAGADPGGRAVDPLELQARMLGVPVDQVRRAGLTPEVTGAAPPVAPTPAPVWDPSIPVPGAGFGVRVVAVLLDVQPPRAILGLPDGTEQVVTAGAMVPSHGLVVLAIGRDAVQVAKVSPNGYSASVVTDTIRALYPVVPAPSAP